MWIADGRWQTLIFPLTELWHRLWRPWVLPIVLTRIYLPRTVWKEHWCCISETNYNTIPNVALLFRNDYNFFNVNLSGKDSTEEPRSQHFESFSFRCSRDKLVSQLFYLQLSKKYICHTYISYMWSFGKESFFVCNFILGLYVVILAIS